MDALWSVRAARAAWILAIVACGAASGDSPARESARPGGSEARGEAEAAAVGQPNQPQVKLEYVSSTSGFYVPNDVTVGPDGFIYVADTGNHRIVKLDQQGRITEAFGSLGQGARQFNWPMDVAINRDGGMVVADAMNNRVELFNRARELRARIQQVPATVLTGALQPRKPNPQLLLGEPQDLPIDPAAPKGAPTHIYAPHGVSIAPRGEIVIADTMNHRVCVATPAGVINRVFGGFGEQNEQLRFPHDAVSDETGAVYVSDFLNHSIKKFDRRGQHVATFGKQGAGNGQFYHPWGVALDIKRKLVFIGDMSNHRVQVLTTDGRFLTSAGKFGKGAGEFDHPKGIAVAGDVLWVAVPGKNSVDRYRIVVQ